MKKSVVMTVVFFGIILVVIALSTMNLAQHRVEVCMTFNGRTNCRTASGSTEEFARRTATTNACAELASGVTDSMACDAATPTKINVLK